MLMFSLTSFKALLSPLSQRLGSQFIKQLIPYDIFLNVGVRILGSWEIAC